MTTAAAIREKLEQLPLVKPFTPALFAGLGSRAAIDQALLRLTRQGVVQRLTRGVYIRPKRSRFGFWALPSAWDVAQVLAQQEGATLGTHGAKAAQVLGLSTQVPMQEIFLTTGAARRFNLGKLQVRLKPVAARKLVAAGTPVGLALAALWYLGKNEVTAATFGRIQQRLSPQDFQGLVAHQRSMPGWMSDTLREYLQGAPSPTEHP